jgi:O-antigen/teichoic acid export membrane protein
MLKSLFKFGGFAYNVVTLTIGTVISQVLLVIGSPFLTRIYSPEAFGVFGTFFATIMILAPLACFRYELAIILPLQNKKSLNIMALCLIILGIVSVTLLAVVLLFNFKIIRFAFLNIIPVWLILVPVGVFLMGINNILYYWSIRIKAFKMMSISRIVASFVTILMQVILGCLYNNSIFSMIFGYLTGLIISIAILGAHAFVRNRREVKYITYKFIWGIAKRYKNFPKFMALGHFFNALSAQMPIYLLNMFFGKTTSGFYVLTSRVVDAPASIIGNAVSDVFRQQASFEYAINKQCRQTYLKILGFLVVISIIPFTCLFLFSPYLFGIVFGKNWIVAGEYAQIMVIMFFLSFVTSPLSSLCMVAEKQKLEFIWQVCRIILSFVSFVMGYYLFNNAKIAIALFTGSFSLLYIVNALITFYLSGGSENKSDCQFKIDH